MNTEDKKEISSIESRNVDQVVDKSRRSFSKKGLVAPVMLTLANRSAWGANACLGSGFQSYALAVKNGVTPSHSALDNTTAGTSSWKSPQVWYDSFASWDKTVFFPVRQVPALGGTDRIYEMYSVPFGPSGSATVTWHSKTSTKNYKLSEVDSLTSPAVWRVKQLFGGSYSDNVTTIYDALSKYNSANQTEKLLAYQVATKMNDILFSLPYPPELIILDDYILFYDNCV